jgi:putative tricarboxylic transport membrane protein
MIHEILNGLWTCLQPLNFSLILGGVILGLIIGALPGLSSPMAIIVLLPVTYSMDTLPAILAMMGVYVASKLGGSYSAILLRTPGTPAAACTALDGYPMAQRGEAGLALGYATMGSTFGGLFGWVIAVTCVPLLGVVAAKSSNADIALVGILGLVMVSAFIRGSTLKGLIGVVVGLLATTIGLSPIDGVERFTFGQYQLLSGVPFAAALVGLFGYAVVLSDIEMIGQSSSLIARDVRIKLPRFSEIRRLWDCILIGGLWGVGVGAVPGVGAEVSPWLAYGTVRNKSKHREKFGTGIPEGVVVSEATANANCGGTMVPMLTLGIPGDGSTAIMLGALILHGLQPGVLLIHDQPDLVYGILASLLVATICMFFVSWTSIRYFIAILRPGRSWLFPFVLVLATIGAFASSNSFYPVYVAVAFGLIGFVFESFQFPIVTLVLGIMLGPIVELNTRLALELSNGDWGTFVATWPRVLMVCLIVGLLGYESYQSIRLPVAVAAGESSSA